MKPACSRCSHWTHNERCLVRTGRWFASEYCSEFDLLRHGSRSSTAGANTASRNSSMSSDSPRSSVVTPDDAQG